MRARVTWIFLLEAGEQFAVGGHQRLLGFDLLSSSLLILMRAVASLSGIQVLVQAMLVSMEGDHNAPSKPYPNRIPCGLRETMTAHF